MVSRFANDIRLYKSVKCPTDCDSLQKNLKVVYEWAIENNMNSTLKNVNTFATTQHTQYTFIISIYLLDMT